MQKKTDECYIKILNEFRDKAKIRTEPKQPLANLSTKINIKQLITSKCHRKIVSEHQYSVPKLKFEYTQSKNSSPRFRIKQSPQSTTARTSRQTSPPQLLIKKPYLMESQNYFTSSTLTRIDSPQRKQYEVRKEHMPTTPRIITDFIDTPNLKEELHQKGRTKKEMTQILLRALFKLKQMDIDPETMIEKRVFSKKPYQRNQSNEFIHAVKLNQIQKVVEMLEKNRYLVFDFDYYNMTALHWACKKGQYEMVDLLIKNHSDVDAVDILHRTPLYISIEGNHNQIVELLLKNKAYPWSTKKTDLAEVIQENLRVKRLLTQVRRIDIINLWADKKVDENTIF